MLAGELAFSDVARRWLYRSEAIRHMLMLFVFNFLIFYYSFGDIWDRFRSWATLVVMR